MHFIASISHHGYLVVALVLFVSSLGIPLPASVALLLGGAAAAHHVLAPGWLVVVAIGAAFVGDSLLFFGGRYSGWWLLALICRISINPESCIFGSAEYFYKRGAKTLMFAKFLPGLGAMAAPLAGSLHMRYRRFARLDLFNVCAYCLTWLTAGFFLNRFIAQMEMALAAVGHLFAIVAALLVLVYLTIFTVFTLSARRYRLIERVPVSEVARRLKEHTLDHLVVIADVRSHGYYDPGTQRIKNSIRLEPNRLTYEFGALREFMQPECEIYVYCSCARESTSARVAHMLAKQNCTVKIIEGGLRAWVKGGYPLEAVPASEVEHLPSF